MPPTFKAAKPFGTATAHAESSVGHKQLTNSLMVLIMKDLPVQPMPLQTTNIQSGVKLQAHTVQLHILSGEGLRMVKVALNIICNAEVCKEIAIVYRN